MRVTPSASVSSRCWQATLSWRVTDGEARAVEGRRCVARRRREAVAEHVDRHDEVSAPDRAPAPPLCSPRCARACPCIEGGHDDRVVATGVQRAVCPVSELGFRQRDAGLQGYVAELEYLVVRCHDEWPSVEPEILLHFPVRYRLVVTLPLVHFVAQPGGHHLGAEHLGRQRVVTQDLRCFQQMPRQALPAACNNFFVSEVVEVLVERRGRGRSFPSRP